MTNAAMTNDQRMTKAQAPMTNGRADDSGNWSSHIGHCTLVIHWSLRHWSLVIYSQTNDQVPMTNNRADDLGIGHCTLVIHWSLRHWSLVIYSHTMDQGPVTNSRPVDSGTLSLHLGHSLLIA